MYLPQLSGTTLDANPPVGVTLIQGQLVENGVLDFLLVDTDTEDYITPYSITYSVGFVSVDDGSYHVVGRSDRDPVELRTGRFRPNFMVGDSWFTGSYLIVWSYAVNSGDTPISCPVPFTVATAGLSDRRPQGLSVYDFPATLVAQ